MTAVCNTKNVELVRSLGADRVIDYTQEDFTKNGETYDVIFDAVGSPRAAAAGARSGPAGSSSRPTGPAPPVLACPRRGSGTSGSAFGIAKYTKEDVLFLKQLIEAGEYRAVIDRSYPLEDVVEATRYVETGRRPATSS